jgi:hypothetical protein
MSAFAGYIGIDYSGAAGPDDRVSGLRAYVARVSEAPVEATAPGRSPRWSRRALHAWLDAQLRQDGPWLVGIDHGFSLPLDYLAYHQLPRDWDGLLDDFVEHWPAQRQSVESLRDGNPREGRATWRRATEQRVRGTKSVFHFDVQGSVAKSTHAGLPWLRQLRRAQPALHCWPFDGWTPPAGRSVLAEVFPTLARGLPAPSGLTADQRDAWCVCEWLRRADADGRLAAAFAPALTPAERAAATVEGWILGVGLPPDE